MAIDPQRFLTRLGTVSELPMRIALWRECFEEEHPEQALEIVQSVLAAQRSNHPHAAAAILALGRLIQSHRTLVQKALLGAATVAQDRDVLKLLEDDAPVKVAHRTQLRPPPLRTDRDITLGERRSWARGQDRDVLTRLLRDPDPGVIRNLLRNPRLLERDVLRVASAQPVSGEVLKVIFESDKWCRRKEIQLALLQNPYTPPDMARALLELMDDVGLKMVADAQQIHGELRITARQRTSLTEARHELDIDALQDEWVVDLMTRRDDEDDPEDL